MALLAGCSSTPRSSAPQPVLMAIVSKALPGVTIYDAATDRQICQAKMDVAPLIEQLQKNPRRSAADDGEVLIDGRDAVAEGLPR